MVPYTGKEEENMLLGAIFSKFFSSPWGTYYYAVYS